MFKKIVKVLSMMIVAQLAFTASLTSAYVFQNKTSTKESKLSPGVVHTQETYKTGSVREAVHMLNIDLNDQFTKLEIGIPNPLNQLKTTSAFAKENSFTGHRVIGATNAAFYGAGPVNLIAENNTILRYGILGTNYESPTQKPVAFGISKSGKAIADYYTTNLTVKPANGNAFTINGVNRNRGSEETILHTSAVSSTGTNEWGVEVVVHQASKDTKSIAFGDKITGKVQSVTQIGQGGNAKVPKDGFVISTHNTAARTALANLAVGTEITVDINIDQKWQDAEYILGAGPLIVKDKKTHISMPEASSFVKSRHPRTAIGVDATGKKIFLVTVDGRMPGYSNGTSLQDLSKLLIAKGAVSAINLDGGGSTTMVTSQPGSYVPKMINRSSDGFERKVSAIFQAVSVAPPGEIKTFQVAATATQLEVGGTAALSIKNPIDIYDNPYQQGTSNVTWKVEGNIGKVEGNKFIATKPGTGNIVATINNKTVKLQMRVAGTASDIYTDVYTDHWAYSSIMSLNKDGYIQGYPDGTFKPGKSLTRGEAASLIARGLHLTTTKPNPFTDVDPKNFAYKDIAAVAEAGIVVGKKENQFFPNDELTRAEMAVILNRAFTLIPVPNQTTEFSDVPASHWAAGSIKQLAASGLTSGYSDGTFGLNRNITRAEFAVFLDRIFKY